MPIAIPRRRITSRAAEAASPVKAPTTRLRRVQPAQAPAEPDADAAEQALQAIANLDRQMAELSAQRDKAVAEIGEMLKDASVGTVLVGAGMIAEVQEVKTKTSNTIDPQKFRQKCAALNLGDAAFYSAITVSSTAAKKLLSERELQRITTSIPGKVTGKTVSIGVYKPKKAKK